MDHGTLWELLTPSESTELPITPTAESIMARCGPSAEMSPLLGANARVCSQWEEENPEVLAITPPQKGECFESLSLNSSISHTGSKGHKPIHMNLWAVKFSAETKKELVSMASLVHSKALPCSSAAGNSLERFWFWSTWWSMLGETLDVRAN